MKFINENSDEATLVELGERLTRYRLNRNLTQAALAAEAGVSKRTLHRVEHGESTHLANLIRIMRALKLLENLEAVVPQPALSPIQQVKMLGKKRQRASSSSETAGSEKPWSWGDEE